MAVKPHHQGKAQDLMNMLGYDAMTPGNHDFNYGYERSGTGKEHGLCTAQRQHFVEDGAMPSRPMWCWKFHRKAPLGAATRRCKAIHPDQIKADVCRAGEDRAGVHGGRAVIILAHWGSAMPMIPTAACWLKSWRKLRYAILRRLPTSSRRCSAGGQPAASE